jgi:hypothetical protein
MTTDNLSPKQWKQEPLLHTPRELHKIASSLLDPNHPDLSGHYDDPSHPDNNYLHYIGNNKESAAGECDSACRMVRNQLPQGSHEVIYTNHTNRTTHHVIHVPTTEGMHTVDYTHRQFQSNAKFPVVEATEKFHTRMSRFGFDTMDAEPGHQEHYKTDSEGNLI